MDSDLFEPLAPRWIRLLKLRINPKTNLISFKLYVVSLEEHIEYNALSYTWDDALEHFDDQQGRPAPKEITDSSLPLGIDSSIISITRNLQDALKYLFISGYSEQFLWVDAICINQADSKEKRIQVSLMGEIYSKANLVIAWLGKETIDWLNFEWLHRRFLSVLEAYIDKYSFNSVKEQSPFHRDFLAKFVESPPCGNWDVCWVMYFRFYWQRRWFTRAWIAQEVALAKNIIIKCGLHSMSWYLTEKLLLLLEKLDWTHLVTLEGVHYGNKRVTNNGILRLRAARVFSSQHQEPTEENTGNGVAPSANLVEIPTQWYINLQTLLYNTRSTHATDPRDKIYANLGIASQALPRHTDLPTQLQPDYSSNITAESTYYSTAKLLLNHIPRLATLSYVEDKSIRNFVGLPSWVPDYSIMLMPIPLISLGSFNCWPGKTTIPPIVKFSDSILEASGACLARVKTVCTPIWEANDAEGIGSLLILLDELEPVYTTTGQSRVEALWRTMIANTVNKGIAPIEIKEHFKKWVRGKLAMCLITSDPAFAVLLNAPASDVKRTNIFRNLGALENELTSTYLPSAEEIVKTMAYYWHRILQFLLSRKPGFGTQDNEREIKQIFSIIDQETNEFNALLSETSYSRRVYSTAEGYLGLGPESTEMGDEVWMLETAAVPFILRKKEGRDGMVFMGESYLHGFMYGERFNDFKEKIVNVKLV